MQCTSRFFHELRAVELKYLSTALNLRGRSRATNNNARIALISAYLKSAPASDVASALKFSRHFRLDSVHDFIDQFADDIKRVKIV